MKEFMKKQLLYEGYSLTRKPPLNYADIKSSELFIKEVYSYPAAYLLSLRNAYVTPYGIVMHKWRVLPASKIVDCHALPSFMKKIVLGRVRHFKHQCLVATNSFYDNYYHFTAESLPRLLSAMRQAPDAALLLHEAAPRFVKEYVSLLGFDRIEYLAADELARVDDLLFPMHTAQMLSQNPQAVREVADYLKAKVSARIPDFTAYKNIYISRQRAAYRKVLNEEAVIALLEGYGFQTILLEDYSVAEQIAMLSNVRNFVSVHGAGISNIMYMPAGGLVVDLIHEHHYDPAFFNLANTLGHDTIFLQCEAANQDARGVAWDSFTVDVGKLKQYLDAYLK